MDLMTTLVVVVAVICAGAVVTFIGARLIERAHRPRGRFIDVGGFRQHVIELGQAADPKNLPVVLLHGAAANLQDMNLALSSRLAARHRVILIDRPGFGHSNRETQEGKSPAYQSSVLRVVLNQLGVDRAIIVGHSWGGTLALIFALDHPERVAGLVLVAAPTYPHMRYMTLHNKIFATPLGWLFAHTLALPIGLLLIWLGVQGAFLPQKAPSRYVKRSAAMLILRPESLLANWTDVGGLDPFLREQVSRYSALSVPTVALNGDRDRLVRPELHAMKLAETVPIVKVEVLPGFGHMLHYDAADRIVAAVEEIALASSK
jgi:pimeloyl-ACP methyl ester carboxylesterase